MVPSTIELIDRFQALLHLESKTTYRFNNYLSSSGRCKDIKVARTKVIGWLYHIVDTHLLLDRELVYVAMNYFDRYVSMNCWAHYLHPTTLVLVGVTSLYVAIKIFRNEGKCASVVSFSKLSKGKLTESDIISMEKSILDTLQWRMHPPTPQSFLELLIIFVPSLSCSPYTRRALYERIKFLLELSVTVPFFFGHKPSSIAVAAFIEVMEHEQEPNVRKKSCRAHFRYCLRSIAGIYCDSKDIADCRQAMMIVHKNALHQMNVEVMNERECTTESPVASKNQLAVVTP